MKSFYQRIVIIVLTLFFGNNLKAHVYLDYPQGGEMFTHGQTVTVQWTIAVPHITLNWDLSFSSDGGLTWTVIQNDIPPEQLTYTWFVPTINTTQGRIRIFMDNDGMDYQDISGDFSIGPLILPPEIDQPAMDAIIECNPDNQLLVIEAWLNNHGGASVINYCGALTWTHDYTGLSNECGATGNSTVTFTATDSCGSVTTTALLAIVDTQPPSLISSAADMINECENNGSIIDLTIWLSNHGGANAIDNCGNITWSNNYTGMNDGCGATGSATVTFTATDECANSVSTISTFKIADSVNPVIITMAQDETIECGDINQEIIIQNWLNNHGGASAGDVCSNVTWTNNYTGPGNECGATGSANVLFTAIDECGNSNTTNASLHIVDTTSPVIQTPARDTTIVCGSSEQTAIINNWLANQGGARAIDNCGNVVWTNDYQPLPDTCTTTISRTVHFRAADECGNFNLTSATITILGTSGTSPSGVDDLKIKIFPNPVTEIMTIEIDNYKTGFINLALFDSLGKILWSANDYSELITIPVDNFASGIYFIGIHSKAGNYWHKVIID